jgi:hypothetical protein
MDNSEKGMILAGLKASPKPNSMIKVGQVAAMTISNQIPNPLRSFNFFLFCIIRCHFVGCR